MNVTKSIIIVAAMLITTAGMAGINNYSNTAADAIRAATHASADIATPVTTLPTITVRPTREQLRELRNGTSQDSAAAVSANSRMPYYSFASDEAGA